MAAIFVSYRRSDAWAYAGRICDRLKHRFGGDAVFMDVETIEPGAPFGQVIERHIGDCRVFITLIGPTWISATGPDGKRRLDDPDDLVRREVALALTNDRCLVIPVQVGNAALPARGDLPEVLKSLSERNAFELRDQRFAKDSEELIDAIDKALGSPWRRRYRGLGIAAAVVVFASLGSAMYLWRADGELELGRQAGSTESAAFKMPPVGGDPASTPTLDVNQPGAPVGDVRWFGALPQRMAGIASAAFDQFSQETKIGGTTHGLFSYHFAEALGRASSDRNGDGKISWQEAVEAAAAPVAAGSSNTQSPVTEGPAKDFALFSASAVTDKQVGKVYVLLIGISQYRIDSAALRGPTHDVDLVARLFARADRLLTRNVEVKTLKDESATQVKIWDGIEWLIKAPGVNDVVVVYYSGHMTSESAGPSGPRYKAIYPYDMHSVGKISIRVPEIIKALKATKARHVVCIVDA
jgi:hypothetical protein